MLRLLTIILFCLPDFLSAQPSRHQLVLIKNDQVVIRYQRGDDFVYKRKSATKPVRSFIAAITDSTIITINDTIATHQIERIYFSKGNLANIIGGFLAGTGAMIFLVDQANTIIVNGESPSLDNGVTRLTITTLAIGLPMMLFTKKSHRVGFRQRLRIINRESPFYYMESRVN